MDEIPERYNLESIEQLRGVADSLRLRIYEALAQRAMTATQVGEEMQIAAPKAHYHVRELERLGLVRLVETRERGGILEKYYRAVARNLIAPPQLLRGAKPEEVVAAVTEVFTNLSQSFLTAMGRYAAEDEPQAMHSPIMDGVTLWMTPQELKQMVNSVEDLFAPFRKRRGLPDEREARVTLVGFDAQLAEQDESDTQMGPGMLPDTSAAVAAPSSELLRRRVSLVGALTYSREDLERVIAAGEWLDIDVVGYLSFGDDVTAPLIDRAIAHLRYRGVLSASRDVLDALKRKEK